MRQTSLYNKLLLTIQKESFYYQRFDACLHNAHFIPYCELTGDKRKPLNDTVRVLVFENDTLNYYFRMTDFKKMTEKILDLSKNDPDISSKLMYEWEADERIFYKKCEELKNTDFGNLSDEDLISQYMDFSKKYINRLSSTSIIDGFVLYYDKGIAEKITKELSDKNIKEKEIVFSKLLASTFESFLASSEIFLLQIVQKIRYNENILKRFNKGDYKDIEDDIHEYRKRFFWIRNNLVKDEKITKNDVIEELKILLDQNIDFAERREFLLKAPLINKERKLRLYKDLRISGKLQTILKISDDFAMWQDQRRKSLMISTYYFSKIFDEIARRLKGVISSDKSLSFRASPALSRRASREISFSKTDLKYLLPSEIEKIFKLSKKELKKLEVEAQKRRTLSAILYYKNGFEIITDPEKIEKLRRAVIDEEDFSGIKELRGLSACPGKVVGKVCVLKSALEAAKLKSGQILVAVMTRPDYITAMRKCSAIVTDEGGITSHAAVVAREFNIPCIVGTKIATKVLNDGDTVQVDGDEGVVERR